MTRKLHQSPTSVSKSTKSTRDSRESTPTMTTTTPATSVHTTSSPKTNGVTANSETNAPSNGVVTEEMIKEESDLYAKDLAESSSQVGPNDPKTQR